MGQYDEFFDQLTHRLCGHGFSVTRNVESGSYRFELVAVRSAIDPLKLAKVARFIIASDLNPVDDKTVKDYSKQATKYALANRNSLIPRGFGGGLLSVPVLVSDAIPENMKTWTTNTIPEWHFSAWELPVLVSPKERRIYYCKKTPIQQGAYYIGFRKFVEEELGFQ